jgi:hypothetical protein
MAEQEAETRAFMTSFKGFMDQVVAQAPEKEPVFVTHLRTHFAMDPKQLPIVTEQFEQAEHPNIHVAITEMLARAGRSFTLLGVVTVNDYMGVKISHLLGAQRGMNVTEGPVEYVNIKLNDGRVLACVQSGLYLIRESHEGQTGQLLALLLRGPREAWGKSNVDVEVMAPERELAEHFLAELRTTMRARNVYRSHVISLAGGGHSPIEVKFHRLTPITRNDIILPEGVLDRIERQTIGFSRVRDKLLAAGRHLKRGLLLYGPPGTGKTLTAMYIAHQMKERTTILITGRTAGLLVQSSTMARLLQPSTVILEDVDLIAEERTQQDSGCNVLLFELLNQMDGLAEDADVLFVLTTNRPDILEPALAARPGRIDQAIEVPLPDRNCRQRLFELYGRGLTLNLQYQQQWIDQTEGVSATFIRELIRKAALFAADELEDIVVEDRHIEAALKELVLEGGELTKRLLGASRAF